MRKFIASRSARLVVAVSGAVASFVGIVATAGATADPTLTDATDQATGYFTDNLPIVIGAFILVAGVLWMLALVFRSIGLHKKKAVG